MTVSKADVKVFHPFLLKPGHWGSVFSDSINALHDNIFKSQLGKSGTSDNFLVINGSVGSISRQTVHDRGRSIILI